jgi:hypothetical protein
MKKEIELIVPKDWSAISLKRYLRLQRDIEVYGEEENGYVATLLHHLCSVEPTMIPKLPTDILNNIKLDLAGFMGKTELPLQRIVTIDGVEWGIEPNLSTMEYGAYLDITKYESITIDNNWAKIMNVLYRRVTDKKSKFYNIESYTAEDNTAMWENVTMDVHFGTLFFFVRLLTDLPQDILNSLMTTEGLPAKLKSDLEKNGKLIKALSTYPTTILPNSKQSLKHL